MNDLRPTFPLGQRSQIETTYRRLLNLSASRLELHKFHDLLEQRMTPQEVLELTASDRLRQPGGLARSALFLVGSAVVRVVALLRQFCSRQGRRLLWGPVERVSRPRPLPPGFMPAQFNVKGNQARINTLSSEWLQSLPTNLSEHVGHYRSVSRDSHLLFCLRERRARLLVVGWTGRRSRLMAPSAQILSALEAINADLLLLRYRPGGVVWTGRLGDGGARGEGVAIINRTRVNGDYKHLSILGTSLGTIPALESSAAIECDKVALVGFSDWGSLVPGFEQDSFLSALRSGRNGKLTAPNLSFTYGNQAEIDMASSTAAARKLHGKTHSVESAGHGAIFALASQGRLEAWVEEHLAPAT